MIVVLHEALEWSESHCKATKEKYPELKGFDTIVDLVVAYQEGAKFQVYQWQGDDAVWTGYETTDYNKAMAEIKRRNIEFNQIR